jgi:photosystem II stability/assembly factor-like uncharacterized protein
MFLALEYDGIGKSENGGDSIQLVNHGFVDRSISALTRSGDKLFALETQEGETSGIFSSTDRGESWIRLQAVKGLAGVHLKTLSGLPSNANILVAASPHQMFKSVDSGNSWKPLPVRVIEPPPPAISKPKPPAAVKSTHHTTAGTRTTRPVKSVPKFRQVYPSEVNALYSLKSGTEDLMFVATDLGLLKSTDAGEHWMIASIPGSPAVAALYTSPDGTGPFIVRAAGGLYSSKDCGTHWDPLSLPVPPSDVIEVAIASNNGAGLLAATRVGLYSSPDSGSTWFASSKGIPASTISSVLFSNQEGVAYAVEYGRLYQTVNNGEGWREVPTALPSLRIRRLWLPDLASGRLYGITGDLGILFRDQGVIR